MPGLKPYKSANTGKKFRVAEGTLIPNEGELKVKGLSNKSHVDIKAQVAKVTKPLASTIEMADAGNIVITHKTGGLVKQLSPEAVERVMMAIKRENGTELEIARKDSTYVMEVEVPEPEIKAKRNTGVKPMEVDHVSANNRWAPFWEMDCAECKPGAAMPCRECKPGMPFPRLS